MKIIGICGSARKGNTEQMLNWVLDACKAESAGIKLVRLSELDIRQCTGCAVCDDEDIDCSIEDGMTDLIKQIMNADAIIFGTPNYFNNVSGLMKVFIDRTNPLSEPPRLKDKLAAFVCVGARPTKETDAVSEILEDYCRIMKMELVGSVVAQADAAREISSQEKTQQACAELGKNIIRNIKD